MLLRKAINLNDITIPVGTKLTPELLLELDYSEVDEIVCGVQDSDKVYVFKNTKFTILEDCIREQPILLMTLRWQKKKVN